MSRIDKLNELLKTSPGDCFLHHALGLEYLKIGNTDAALQSFQQVLNINPAYIGTYYHLAKTFEKLNKMAEAIDVYEKGLLVARKAGDRHAANELQMALDELID